MSTTPRHAVLANDLQAQWRDVRDAALKAVDRVGESGWLVLGTEVAAFEAELAAWHGVPFAVGTANGLDALEIALRASGVEAGSTVVTTPLTAFATTLAIVRLRARPMFVDVDESGLIDLDAAEHVLRTRSDVRAMVPVHLFGHAVDVERLAALRDRHGIAMIEDCAQAIGARHRERPVGSASIAAATSFYPTKNLGCMGDGGAVLATTEEARARAAILRDYGQSAKYVHDVVGLNSRLDEVQAAILRDALLPRLDAFTERRRAVADAYGAGISNPAVRPLPAPPSSRSVWHLYPVVVAGPRERFQAHLKERGITTGIHYPTLAHEQRALDGVSFETFGSLERARAIADAEVSLPIHPYLDAESVARVVDACNAYAP